VKVEHHKAQSCKILPSTKCSRIKQAEEKVCSNNYHFALKKEATIEDDSRNNDEDLLQYPLRNSEDSKQQWWPWYWLLHLWLTLRLRQRAFDTEEERPCRPYDRFAQVSRHRISISLSRFVKMKSVRLETFARERIHTAVFRVMTPFSLECGSQCFGGTCSLYSQW
jgi:hypothetical protein